jgi:hypothetical protein
MNKLLLLLTRGMNKLLLLLTRGLLLLLLTSLEDYQHA